MRKTSACSCCFCCYSSSGVIHLLLNGGIQGGGIFFLVSYISIQEFYGELFKKKIIKTSNFVEVMRKWDGEVLVLGNFNLLSVATHISIFSRLSFEATLYPIFFFFLLSFFLS